MSRIKTTKRRAAPREAEPLPMPRTIEAAKAAPPVELKAYTIPLFCEAHNLSIWTYYRMAAAGTGPAIMKIGHKTLISVEDAEAWRKARKDAARHGRAAANAASAEA
jgi:hypothetical protein